MKIKPSIVLVMLTTLLVSFSMQSLADTATSSLKNKNLMEEIPNITNEAEYAEFVRKREGTGQASSVKSTRSIKSSSSRRASVSSAASSSRAKTLSK